eukprot:XP_006247706.1 PREDICTED: uncharacterized protein LOC102546698 [Rattus norvegicus]
MSHEARPREDYLKWRTRKVLITKSGFVHRYSLCSHRSRTFEPKKHFGSFSHPQPGCGTEYFIHVTLLFVWFSCLLLRDMLITAPKLRAPRLEDLSTRWRTQKVRLNEPVALEPVTRKLASYWSILQRPAQQLPDAFFKLKPHGGSGLLATGIALRSALRRTADSVSFYIQPFPQASE